MRFYGIIYKSNLKVNILDLNPSFDFTECFANNINIKNRVIIERAISVDIVWLKNDNRAFINWLQTIT
jgi:cytosine/uracil/thiamine/allantoin permease